MADKQSYLFCFGLGYCAQAIGLKLLKEGWRVAGTVRSEQKRDALSECGFQAVICDPENGHELKPEALEGVTHILVSAPPGENGDRFTPSADDILYHNADSIEWMGYFSTTGVYGDHDGGWVDESTPVNPASERGERRVRAEESWQTVAETMNVPLSVFRLPGIYGPGRNALTTLKKGKARRIVKKGQVFSRIHRDDIVQTVLSAINLSEGRVFNVVDDEAAPPQDVISYAASLLGIDPPPEIPFENADLSPMAQSFYGENKRVKNERIKKLLGIKLLYPDYRAGLQSLLTSDS